MRVDAIKPPLMKRTVDRPKVNRRRELDEVSIHKQRYTLRCNVCGQYGHNKRGCPINLENVNKMTKYIFIFCMQLYCYFI